MTHTSTINTVHMERLINIFLTDCHSRLKAGTMTVYTNRLKAWQVFLQNGSDITVSTFNDYAEYMEVAGLSYHTRKKSFSVLRQLVAWSHSNGYLDQDWSIYMPTTKGAAQPLPILNSGYLGKIIEAVSGSQYPERDRAIIAFMAGTGARREEAIAIDIQDVEWRQGNTALISRTRGNLPRYIAVDSSTGQYLRAYLASIGNPGTGPLFLSQYGRRSGTLAIYRVVQKAASKACVDFKGLGQFRRMFADCWKGKLEGRIYDNLLKMQLGIAPNTTEQLYLLREPMHLLDVMESEQLSPMMEVA